MAKRVQKNGVWWTQRDDGVILRHDPATDQWQPWDPDDYEATPPAEFLTPRHRVELQTQRSNDAVLLAFLVAIAIIIAIIVISRVQG